MKELALKKLEQEKAKVTGQKEQAMAEAVYQALSEFCGRSQSSPRRSIRAAALLIA